MNKTTHGSPSSEATSSVNEPEKAREYETVQKGIAAIMEEDPTVLAGIRTTGAAALRAIDLNPNDPANKKDDLTIALIQLNDYLKRIDAIITQLEAELEELQAQRQAAIERMEQCFEEADAIEDLIDGIQKDGMSPEEAQAAARLLGDKAAGKSPEEIVILLAALQREKEAQGLKASEDVDDLDAKIAETKRQIDVAQDLKDKGVEAAATGDLGKTASFNADAEDFYAKIDAADSESTLNQGAELNAAVEDTFVQSQSADVVFDDFDFG